MTLVFHCISRLRRYVRERSARRRAATLLAQADALTLVRTYDVFAYHIARRFELDNTFSNGTIYNGRTRGHWRRVARLIEKVTTPWPRLR
jgi:hypothetical protein